MMTNILLFFITSDLVAIVNEKDTEDDHSESRQQSEPIIKRRFTGINFILMCVTILRVVIYRL